MRITWLQLSDFHIRIDDEHFNNIIRRTLLEDVARQIETEGLLPDFIIISGDIAFASHPDEYKTAEQFLDELIQIVGIEKDRLCIVPGNHDVDRNVIAEQSAGLTMNLPNGSDEVDRFLSNDRVRKFVFQKFHSFADFVNNYFEEHLHFSGEDYFYTRTLDIGGRNIAILGLNSAWASGIHKDDNGKTDDTSRMLIGKRQLHNAIAALPNAFLRIAVLHHPLDWLTEFDRTDVQILLDQECDLIVHGHMHRTTSLQEIAPDGRAMTIAAGACYTTNAYPVWYNFVRLDFETRKGTIYPRIYDQAKGTWMLYRDGQCTWDIGYILDGTAPVVEGDGKTILVVFAHADDMDLGCAGTLQRFRAEGYRIYGLMLTDNSGTAKNDAEKEKVIAEREEEAQNSAKVLGLEKLFFGRFRDRYLLDTGDTVSEIRKYIDLIRPSIVFTHTTEDDKHNDHRNAGRATVSAVKDKATDILKFEVYTSEEKFKPAVYVDISENIKVKKDALNCYPSQIPAHITIEDAIGHTKTRGDKAGFAHAECFEADAESVTQKYPHIFMVPWVNSDTVICEHMPCPRRHFCESVQRLPDEVCTAWGKLKPKHSLKQFPEYFRNKQGDVDVVIIFGDRRFPGTGYECQVPDLSGSTSDAVEIIRQIAFMGACRIGAFIDRWPGAERVVAENNLIIVGGGDVNLHTQVLNSVLEHEQQIWFSRYREVINAGPKATPFRRHGHLEHDYGLVFLLQNPYNPEYYALWLAGLSGKGTTAAIRFAMRDAPEFDFSEISVKDPIGCIVQAHQIDTNIGEVHAYELCYAIGAQGESWMKKNGGRPGWFEATVELPVTV